MAELPSAFKYKNLTAIKSTRSRSKMAIKWKLLNSLDSTKMGDCFETLVAAANGSRSGSEGHRFETRCQERIFFMESPLKPTLTLVIVICIHNISSCVRCFGWQNVSSRKKGPTKKSPIKEVLNL